MTLGELLMPEYHRSTDVGNLQANIRMVADIIKTLGFPIIVCIWMAYQQTSDKRVELERQDANVRVMVEFKSSIDALTNAVLQQNRLLRHKSDD